MEGLRKAEFVAKKRQISVADSIRDDTKVSLVDLCGGGVCVLHKWCKRVAAYAYLKAAHLEGQCAERCLNHQAK
jgi:hypothetical protein